MKREVELGSHSEMGCLLLQVSTVGFSGSVFETLFRTAVERASCGIHKVLCSRGVPTSFKKNSLKKGSLRREYDFLSLHFYLFLFPPPPPPPVRLTLFKVFQI